MKTLKIKDWTAALRSGKYVKGRLALKNKDGSNCCLGVACELLELPITDSGSRYSFDFDFGTETRMNHWPTAQHEQLNHLAISGGYEGKEFMGHLMTMNDNIKKPTTFNDIADEIEKYCDPEAEIIFYDADEEA